MDDQEHLKVCIYAVLTDGVKSILLYVVMHYNIQQRDAFPERFPYNVAQDSASLPDAQKRNGMRKIGTLAVLTGLLVFHPGAYGQVKIMPVNGYIHDIDEAKSVIRRDKAVYDAEVARRASNPQVMVKFINTESPITNASKAVATIQTAYEFKKPLSKCFDSSSFATATTAKTDHACLDAAGFKR